MSLKPLSQFFSKQNQQLVTLLLLSTGFALWQVQKQTIPINFLPIATASSANSDSAVAIYEKQVLTQDNTHEVHAASLVETDNGLMAFWYGGSAEGAKDVSIFQALRVNGQWGQAKAVASRAQSRQDMDIYIRKLGNPVAYRQRNRVYLFYVSVSVGGWAASRVNVMISHDQGKTWGQAKQLVTSPMLNLSTLVKGSAINLSNDHLGLPVYHELAGKFGEWLVLDSNADVVFKSPMGTGRDSLQPVVIATTKQHAVAFMRYAGEQPARVLRSESDDGGISWSQPSKLNLPNPNAAVAVLPWDHNRWLMVFNNHEDLRNDLSLALTTDQGHNWRVLHQFEYAPANSGSHEVRYSYPSFIRGQAGLFHLAYTDNRQRLQHITFNQSWLEQKL